MEDDASILRRSLTAPDSFAELFRRHAGAIGRYLARRIGPHDAEDVLADTFLEAFRQRARYDLGQPNAPPWLYGIATHRLGRHKRSELKQLKVLARSGVDPVAAAFTERSDARVDADQAVRPIAECLRRLPCTRALAARTSPRPLPTKGRDFGHQFEDARHARTDLRYGRFAARAGSDLRQRRAATTASAVSRLAQTGQAPSRGTARGGVP